MTAALPARILSPMSTRIPPDPGTIELLDEDALPPAACRRLLRFSLAFHERNLSYFLELRDRWHAEHPGRSFPGLCANVNPLTGDLRPDEQQMLWGWGDGRALSTWSGFLAAGRVPPRLREGLTDYVHTIYRGLRSRCRDGYIPFSIHYRDSPSSAAGRVGYSTSFACTGFCRYGLFCGDRDALDLGLDLLRICRDRIRAGQFDAPPTHHGPRMILVGSAVDVVDTARTSGRPLPGAAEAELLGIALEAAEEVLAGHFRPDPPAFWEHSDSGGRPVGDPQGRVVVDPGHATELAGFLAELVRICSDAPSPLSAETRRRLLDAALAIHLFADRIGFTEAGVMTKYADLSTGEVLGDTQAAGAAGRPTAPWWNVREHSAAALRLYTLLGDPRLPVTYRRAQNASYRHYPNERIGGQMIQSVDPWTCEPLDIAPATGNLDPMHDARARMREIECLELLLRDPRPWEHA